MPKFNMGEDVAEFTIPGAGNFKFSGARPENLGADEYTLVTIAVDHSGSVYHFEDKLLETVKSIVGACNDSKNSAAEKIMIRLIKFNQDVSEIHGFIEAPDIDQNSYESFQVGGVTSLFDAMYSAIGATVTYGENLIKQKFDVNADIYVITDGCDNNSTMGPKQIKEQIEKCLQKEEIESIRTFLIGLHDPNDSWGPEVKAKLEKFRTEADITEFIDVGAATSDQLAKLANYVSASISSQSQSLGTGGPSQVLNF